MNLIETILLENISKSNSLFIFPTDTASSRWADHLLRIKGGVIPMNKFTAWDKFKQNSIKSKVQGKISIPSALRKIFMERLIIENAQAVKENNTPLFTSLIRPKWAQNAGHFTSWLTSLLPQLGIWYKKTTGFSIDVLKNNETINEMFNSAPSPDEDEKDMLFLSIRYAQFLKEHNFFEPAWEEPPFNDDGKECFLFFPQSLSDYSEYKHLLASSNHVKIINTEDYNLQLKQCSLQSSAFYYTNARREITEASLYIINLHEKENIEWDSIAVCAADNEKYESYLTREFEIRNIPYVKRISRPLSEFPAGGFFSSVLDCVSHNFSFSSLVSLITNKSLPWKDTALIDNLIQFGIKNNCVYSWTEKNDGKDININVWEDAFKNPIEGYDPSCYMFFNSLKNRLTALRSSVSFSQLRKQYFIFRETFFNMDDCSEETDIILSRCISELMNLYDLEKNYPKITASDPYLFFIEHLGQTNYLAQAKHTGVNILPYKTAAASPFSCHIILGANQKSLSVIFKKLDFIPEKKREKLNIFDEDASDEYINLHKFNSLKQSAFFCSELTFSGYSIPHSKINASSKPIQTYITDLNSKFSRDHYVNEFLSDDTDNLVLHNIQKNGFDNWVNRREYSEKTYYNSSSDKIINYIQKKLIFNYEENPRYNELKGKYSVSASALKKYYQCSLSWLFEYILNLDNAQTDTNLMSENISGMVYHSILENFLSCFKEEPLPKPEITEQNVRIPLKCRQLLQDCINSVFDGFKSIPISSLSARFITSEKEQYYFNLERSLARFLSLFAGYTVKGCEKWHQSPRDKFYLNGKIDCILYNEESGKHVIVDFKMSTLQKRAEYTGDENSEPCDFQLPMYITLTEENEKINIYSSLFFSILKLKTEVITGRIHDIVTDNDYPKKEDDCIYRDSAFYNNLLKLFNEKTQNFADEIIKGKFTIYEKDLKKCFLCRVSSLCRRVYTIKNEKNILLGKFNDE